MHDDDQVREVATDLCATVVGQCTMSESVASTTTTSAPTATDDARSTIRIVTNT